jgi:DHA1 family bicyclomycin/chloramphenicol resistance-like MFS transporter
LKARVEARSLLLILGALSAFAPMSIDMYLPALPTLSTVFQASAAQVQWTLASFFIGFAIGQALLGPLTDRYGRKWPLYLSLVLFVAASIGCSLAPSVLALTILRFLQALGACAGGVIARAMVRDLFPPEQAVRVYSALMLVMGVAPILAPLIGGYLLVWLGWPSIFWALAAFGLACLVAVVVGLPETQPQRTGTAPGLGAAFASYGAILRHPQFLRYALVGGCSMAGMFAYIAGSPYVFIQLHQVPAEHYGWLFGLNALGLVSAAQLNGRVLHGRFGSMAVLRRGAWLQAGAGAVLLAVATVGRGGLIAIVLPLFLYVACTGLITPNSTALAMAPHPRAAGAASALLGTLQFGLAALAAVLVGAVHADSAAPMAAVIAASGLAAALAVPHMAKASAASP